MTTCISRRNLIYLASLPIFAPLLSCGGNEEEPAKPVTSNLSAFRLMSAPHLLKSERVISWKSSGIEISYLIGQTGADRMAPNSARLDLAGKSVDFTFTPEGLPLAATSHDGSFLALVNSLSSSLALQYDATGNFILGYGVFEEGGRLFGGKLKFADANSSLDLFSPTDFTELLATTNAIITNVEPAQSSRIYPTKSFEIMSSAFAQGSNEGDPTMQELRRQVVDAFAKNPRQLLLLLVAVTVAVGPAFLNAIRSATSVLEGLLIAVGGLTTGELIVIIAIIAAALLLISKSAGATQIQDMKYNGTFGGDDSGTFGIDVSSTGAISGVGFSASLGSPFVVSGTMSVNGRLLLRGGASTGASFAGQAAGLSLNGTWSNEEESGTFEGHAAI